MRNFFCLKNQNVSFRKQRKKTCEISNYSGCFYHKKTKEVKIKTIFWHRSAFIFYYNKTNNDSLLSGNPSDVGHTLSKRKGWSMSPEKHLCNILKKVTSWIKCFYISLPEPDMFFPGFHFLSSPSSATCSHH